MRIAFFLIVGLVFLVLVVPSIPPQTSSPEKLLIVGIPAWGPSWLEERGEGVPAGCGPEAARLLFWYWDNVLGFRFVQEDPENALRSLHSLMGTMTVSWEGAKQGLTWPWNFARGLEVYAKTQAPSAEVYHLSGSRQEVFAKAVDLLKAGNPPVLLFDWAGEGGIFPTHYALVVGYDLKGQALVVNPGWGYPFQLVPFEQPEIAPASLFWLEFPKEVDLEFLNFWPTSCPVVRSYGQNREDFYWCKPNRVAKLGSDLFLFVWD